MEQGACRPGVTRRGLVAQGDNLGACRFDDRIAGVIQWAVVQRQRPSSGWTDAERA